MKMCLMIVFQALCSFFVYGAGPGSDGSLLFLFWNLENFFDWRDDGASESPSDAEFSSFGKRHWTRAKFFAKCNAVAKTVLWVGDRYGRLPDAVGIAEVENRFVLEQLLESTTLRKLDYRIVHFDSPDPRGIDVALLYRSSVFRLVDAVPLRVDGPEASGPPLLTRDILLAHLSLKPPASGEPSSSFSLNDTSAVPSPPSPAIRDASPAGGAKGLFLLVNHHPSKYGGGKTGWRREAALKRLRKAVDSLEAAGCQNIIAMGDFNDTPDRPFFRLLTDPTASGSGLENLAAPLAESGEGTIRYNGIWQLIDLFFVSKGLGADGHLPKMQIVRVPFLSARDNAHTGEKPFRTWSGPRYNGGVSDHRPVVLSLDISSLRSE